MSVSRMKSVESADKAIVLSGISKSYGSRRVLDNVSLEVERGEIFALLGPNGAGKTTLMKIILGLTRPSAGEMNILGYDGFSETNMVRRLLAFVPQNNNLEKEFTIEQALKTYGRIYGVEDIERRLEQVLNEFRLQDIRGKKIDHLSGGMARRALIARAFLISPEILLMDEPTVGLDPDIRRDIWEIVTRLSRKGCTVFLTTHYMEEAEKLCGRVALLRQGELLATDTTAEIVKKAGVSAGQRPSLETAFIRLLGSESF